MNNRAFLRLFLPPIYYRIKNVLFPVKLKKSPLPQIKHNHKRVVIIGNGPSLNESVSNYKNEIKSCDIIAVNFFASTEYYEELRPNIYVFADPAWFNIPEHLSESIPQLLDNIINKTTWPLRIIIPFTAKGAPIETKLLANKNIKIDYYNNVNQDVVGLSKFEAWDKNLISPPCQTVLNTCVYLALYWGYTETYLIGADTSFIKDLFVDQQTNELFTLDKHFYKNGDIYTDKQLFNKDARRRVNSTLSEEIRTLYLQFKHYDDLAEYAKYKNLKVYNASEYSFIDSFERKKLR